MDDEKTLTITGTHGRDIGKTFGICEIDPLTLSGYVLRLVSAMRVPSYEALVENLQASQGGEPPIDTIMQLLQGADPEAVHRLITELISRYVRVSPDPKHPGVLRPYQSDDIREIRTLGDVLVGVFKLNFSAG